MSSPRSQFAGTIWNPQQYLKFSDHRTRPAIDLLARISIENPKLIYDLGCGTGNVTRMIAERYPPAKVIGVDNSKEMLAQAANESSRIEWIEAPIESWAPPEPPDLILSNATLHWVENHAELFPRLARMLPKGGCLAVQMPMNWAAPSHRLMRETLADLNLGSDELRNAVGRNWVDDAPVYYDLLSPIASNIDIWETEYLHMLEGDDPVLEWVKGTGLRPILYGLEKPEREKFLAEFSARLRTVYPKRANGVTVFPFRRIFLVATV